MKLSQGTIFLEKCVWQARHLRVHNRDVSDARKQARDPQIRPKCRAHIHRIERRVHMEGIQHALDGEDDRMMPTQRERWRWR